MSKIVDLNKKEYLSYNPSAIELGRSNFIYGKNGTGKTTLADLIASQCGDEYNVKIFKGYESSIADNESLNAIALGDENAEIQRIVNEIDDKISELNKEIEDDSKDDNLCSKKKAVEARLSKAEKQLSDAYASAAREIKNMTSPQIVGTSYNKNDFENDKSKACRLSDSRVKEVENNCSIKTMKKLANFVLETCNFDQLKVRVNELLNKTVTETVVLKGVDDDPERRKFAKHGMEIHRREEGELCAFCGNEISLDRWEQLDKLFDDSVRLIQTDLTNMISEVDTLRDKILSEEIPQADLFYPAYQSEINDLIIRYQRYQRESQTFFDVLLNGLRSKKDDVFASSSLIDCRLPEINVFDLQRDINDLIDRNNTYGSNITAKITEAKDSLRYHYVSVYWEKNNCEQLSGNVKSLQLEKQSVDKQVLSIKDQIDSLRKDRNEQISKTVNEETAVQFINSMLLSLGVSTFELRLIKDQYETNGQYAIFSKNKRRSIRTLSTGEKNLVAFLYFIQEVRFASANNDKPVFVIFDDPMNSNDSASQYIMYSQISLYYRRVMRESDILVVLTHNSHFYLNCRPNEFKKSSNRYACFILSKDGYITNVKRIESKNDDIKTAYDALWCDFLHADEQNMPNVMLNELRKIVESFSKFTGVADLAGLMSDANVPTDINVSVASEIKKSLDVGSHGLYDLTIEPETLSCSDILRFAQWYFKRVGHLEHFYKYCPEESVKE